MPAAAIAVNVYFMKTILYIFIALSVAILSAASLFGAGSGSSGGGSSFSANPEEQARSYYDKGMALAEKEKYDRAAGMFRQAVSLKKDFAEAYNMLGFSLRKQGKYDEAIKNYTKALSINPKFAEAHEYIGEAYLGIGDRGSAWEHYLALQKLGSEEAEELGRKIEEYDKASAK